MSRESRFREENDAKLIRSAMDKEARPSTDADRRVLRLLLAEQQERSESTEFPNGILTVLAGMVMAVIVLLGLRMFGLAGLAMSSIPLAVATGLVYLNLAAVPVASIVIVIRRRACQHA